MKIAAITCYKYPDYIRARTLRAGLAGCQDTEILILKNKVLNIFRYPEIITRLLVLKIREKPDMFLLTFRGYEILPLLLVIAWGKPVIFDEFVNPLEWLTEPKRAMWTHLVPRNILAWFYKQLINRCAVVLADTEAHADYSARLTMATRTKFEYVPVSADEQLFRPATHSPERKNFQIVYYGNMLPLHGLEYVLEAANLLKENSHIRFLIIGGKEKAAEAVKTAQSLGARVEYKKWVAFEDLPAVIHGSSLCLGGPFGKTIQASKVITGKTYQFLAAGAPVLVGENEASELFKDKVNSLVVPLGDSEGLVHAITWAYENRRHLPLLGKRGRDLYNQHFSNKTVTGKLQAILDDLPQG